MFSSNKQVSSKGLYKVSFCPEFKGLWQRWQVCLLCLGLARLIQGFTGLTLRFMLFHCSDDFILLLS